MRLRTTLVRAAVGWCGTAAIGCGAEAGREESLHEPSTDQIQQPFKAGRVDYLMPHVHAGSGIEICLSGSGVSAANFDAKANMIRDAVMLWVDGARAAAASPLIDRFAVDVLDEPPDGCDSTSRHLNVIWHAENGRANSAVNLFANDGFPTVLHEIGHNFGLMDTYIEGVWTCEENQPSSVMCDGVFSELQPDDIEAIREEYCMFNPSPSTCTRRAEYNNFFCRDRSLHVGDFDGNGRDDMLCHDRATGHRKVDAAANTANLGFVFGTTDSESTNAWCSHASGQLFVGDFDGNGKEDLVCHDTVTGVKWFDYVDDNKRFDGTDWYSSENYCSHANGRIHIGDFNGDNRDDLLCHDVVNGRRWIDYSTSNLPYFRANWYGPENFCGAPTGMIHIGDFNDDNRDDILCHDISNGQHWIDFASTNGEFYGTDSYFSENWCSGPNARLRVADFNSDGKADLLCHEAQHGNKWIAFATSNGTFRGTSRYWPMSWCGPGGELMVGDFDANGSNDFLCHRPSDGYRWIAMQFP
jgi:hypothetical protein